MRKAFVWILRVSLVLMLVGLEALDGQLTADHRTVPVRPEPQHAVGEGGPSGSWGTWGSWSECSRSCGGGVHEQTRPCLPSYTPPAVAAYPSRPTLHPHPHTLPMGTGRVVSALRPSVPLHRSTGGPPPNADSSNLGSHGDPRGQQRDAYPGRRRGGDSPISPGKYGYGKMPYVLPLQRDPGQATGARRQRRSPLAEAWHSAHQQGQRHGHHSPYHVYNSAQHQAHLAQPRPGVARARAPLLQPGSVPARLPQQEHHARPYSPLPSSACTGQPSQHKICNTNSCPQSSRHIREVQCSSYNSRPFMGRLYEWEPFNEVPGAQHCELNCRAIGFRFYVRQSDSVIDGTPCRRNETSICVAGKCQSLGCDEYLGSGKVLDKCGVCGGDNTSCKLVSGLFQHSLSKVGYHKIVEIPEGATKINVTEMVKSRNYLALRSRSGRSIINGNWAIDRPGKYEGVGTMFTYRRPNEISSTAGESFLAEGPTNEILDVYMIYQQPNPGVHYEFILPPENPSRPHFPPDHQPGGNTLSGQGGFDQHGRPNQEDYDRAGGGRYPPQVPDNQVPQPPRRQREYNWKLSGSTDCSATCGRGSRYPVFGCVHRVSHEQASESQCDSATRPSPQEEPCNMQPCPAFWDIGEWSECSKTCGLGMQHRQVLCRQVYANRTLNVQTARCRHLEHPETASTCQLKICSEWQIRSEWSPCSVPCGVGQKTREVHCVSNVGDFVADEECNMKLRPSSLENCDMGACAKSWFLTEWGNRCSAECGMGVRSRGVLCLTNHISSLPLEGCGSERPPESQVCNNGPCESRIEWFTGPWSQCSAECGAGSQQRTVTCLMKADEGLTVMPPYECSSLDRPLGQQSCHVKACGAKWYHTDWSACSKTCEGGFRLREVRCLSDDMLTSEGCEERLRPEQRETCHPEPCVPQIDENCRDKYFNCNVVVQARLCVYHYYTMACCASCTRMAQRQPGHRGHR